ncbi:MAG: hypothetical protein OXC91_10945 [Rhodobacteraceae bacterium]|nr:hypothetical protein [Paracoccaceae bacterium]
MKHVIMLLSAMLFASAGWAATYTRTEGARVVVTKTVSTGETLALSTGDAADTIKFDGSVDDNPGDKFRVYFISGCPSLISGDTCNGNLTFTSSGQVKIGIQSIDNDCVKQTSLTLTWVNGDDTTTDTYNFGDDDGRSDFWLSLFPEDTNAC